MGVVRNSKCTNGHDLLLVLHDLCALSGVSTFSLAISLPVNFFKESLKQARVYLLYVHCCAGVRGYPDH